MERECELCQEMPAKYVVEFHQLEDGAVFHVCFKCAEKGRKLGASVVSDDVYAAM